MFSSDTLRTKLGWWLDSPPRFFCLERNRILSDVDETTRKSNFILKHTLFGQKKAILWVPPLLYFFPSNTVIGMGRGKDNAEGHVDPNALPIVTEIKKSIQIPRYVNFLMCTLRDRSFTMGGGMEEIFKKK